MSQTPIAPVQAVGDVITFTYTDPLTGQTATRRGVVESVGEAGHLIVQPVGDYFLQVAPAEVQVPAPPAVLEPAPTDPTTTTSTTTTDPTTTSAPADPSTTSASGPTSDPAQPVA